MSEKQPSEQLSAFSRETGQKKLSRFDPKPIAPSQATRSTSYSGRTVSALYDPPPDAEKCPAPPDLFGNPVSPVSAHSRAKAARCRSDAPGKGSARTDRRRSDTEGAAPWYIYHSGNSVRVSIYSGEVSVSTPPPVSPSTPPPKRTAGDIDTFSRKSRIRVFQAFNRLQSQLLGKPIFITLTSRHGELDAEEFQYRFHKKFLPGLKDIIPKCCYIWRLQPHKNGKPHYHLIVWSFRPELTLESRFYGKQIRRLWRNCINQHDKAAQLYSCKIEPVGGQRKTFQYVSRYVAKEDAGKALEIPGRRWGRSLNFPASPIAEITISGEVYNRLLEIVKVVLKSRSKQTDWLDERVNDSFGWFVWLTSQEIVAILDYISCHVGLSRYKRYLETGNPEPSQAELASLSVRYGHDFAPDFGIDELEEFSSSRTA